MRRAAWILTASLLILALAADPASAGCTPLMDDEVTIQVCTDANGNAAPDDVLVDSEIGVVQYSESGCLDCGGPQALHASFSMAGAGLGADLECTLPPGQASADCRHARALADAAVAGLILDYRPAVLCTKVQSTTLTVIHCRPMPDI